MTRNLLVSAVVPVCIAFRIVAVPIPASGQGLFGGVSGVTRDSASGRPLALVRITAHNVNKGTDRTAISGSDGTFTMPGLEPGLYQVAAVRDGFVRSTASVEVAAPGTHRIDLLLAADYPPVREAKPAPEAADATLLPVLEELAALKRRIGELEVMLQARTAHAQPAAEPATFAEVPKAVPAPAASAPAPAPTPQRAAAPPAPSFPEALQSPAPAPTPDNFTPFAFADFTWLNGTPRNKDTVLDTKFFTPEVRFDTHFITSFNQPIDHTLGGSTESFRSGEFQVEQISVGGDFHWQNVRGRILTMNGLFATTTPRNDASTGVGQWDVRNAYRYVSEA